MWIDISKKNIMMGILMFNLLIFDFVFENIKLGVFELKIINSIKMFL